jgi:hypothetical protein
MMMQSIASTKKPSKTCNADIHSLPIDPPQSKYIQTLANHNPIPFDPTIIQSIPSLNLPATTHGRCFTPWQQVGYAFWELEDSLATLVDARGAGTNSETCRPVDVGDQKSNNRYRIDDRDIRKTMVFMKILDIITEMESNKTCMLSILGDGGVTVLHPNHPNYPTDLFGEKSMGRSSSEVNKTMDVPVLNRLEAVQPKNGVVGEIDACHLNHVDVNPCKNKFIEASTSTSTFRCNEKEEVDSSLRPKSRVSETINVRRCSSCATWLFKAIVLMVALLVAAMVVDQTGLITNTCSLFMPSKINITKGVSDCAKETYVTKTVAVDCTVGCGGGGFANWPNFLSTEKTPGG